MALKIRLLYTPGKKKFLSIGELIRVKYELSPHNSVDVIPPAYPCDKEKLVFLAVCAKNEPNDQLARFCREFDPSRARNVALIVDGNAKGIEAVKALIKNAGGNVYDEVLEIKCGLPFLANLNEAEKASVNEFVEKAVAWAK